MELKDMEISALEERKAAIATEAEAEGADTAKLLEEIRAINTELERRAQEAREKEELRAAVAAGAGTIKEKKEDRKMPEIEIRNTKEYIDAYAEYIKTGEKRALLTENAQNGTIPVPEMVYDIVKHAWEKDDIMRLVKKSYIKGVLKVGFEISASGATVHSEGTAVNEENLTTGIVTLVPKSIKKWISISDEALDLTGETFLRYIYEELAYQIGHKAADQLVGLIASASTSSSSTAVGVAEISATQISVGLIASAMGKLSDEANNPVVIMNKGTWAAFKTAQYAANYPVDPFEGLPVCFNNSLDTFASASSGDTFVIVGDLGQGALANFPNGEEIEFKFDDTTLMTSDLVRVLGREFVGLGIVAPGAFVRVVAG